MVRVEPLICWAWDLGIVMSESFLDTLLVSIMFKPSARSSLMYSESEYPNEDPKRTPQTPMDTHSPFL